MEIGNSIAIAGVWIFSGLVWHSKTSSGGAALASTLIAIGITYWLKG